MGLTPTARVWSPDGTEKASLRTLFATLASSIENGLGSRVGKLETFVGCNLGLASAFVTNGDGATKKAPYAVIGTDAPGSFNKGMTVNSGTVTVPYDGLYNVFFTANFLPNTAVVSRLNTYIYVNNVSQNFSSALGAGNTSYYTNCNVSATYNLKKNDQIDVRVATFAGDTRLTAGSGSSLCINLVSRATT